MAEHTWTEGRGLRDGFPDPDWSMRKFLTVYPVKDGWKVTICWGDTWGHIAFGRHEDYEEALMIACENAMKEGCPHLWLPGSPQPIKEVDA